MSPQVKSVRLDKLLANLGYGSRSQIGQMARASWLTLDGETLSDAGARIGLYPDLSQRLLVRGEPLDPLAGVAIMMHKPLGVTCSRKESGWLIYDLLPPRWLSRDPALSTVGRLDKETSGLLLLTDDGALLHKIISPKSHVAKRYHVHLARPLTGGEAARFASGSMLLEGEDKPLLPAELDVLGPQEAKLTVHEGRYHQVRRMFAALGNHVEALHRDKIGGLDLPLDLEAGAWRIMTQQDLSAVLNG